MKEFASFESAWISSIRDVKKFGEPVDPISDSTSIGSGFGKGGRGGFREIINYSWVLNNPRNRLVYNTVRKYSIEYVNAQFLWILSGSDDIKAISHYNPRGMNLSDDGETIWGGYGRRLRQSLDCYATSNKPVAFPGYVDQLENSIETLVKDRSSRRAGCQIFLPVDTLGGHKDIPCTFGIQFLLRNGKLNMITNMRSQSVVFVMPYDIHFFTMLQELVTQQLKFKMGEVELGNYYHNTGSYHFYDSEEKMSEDILDENDYESELGTSLRTQPTHVMPEMSSLSPMHTVESICKIVEPELRLYKGEYEDFRKFGQEKIEPIDGYWRDFIKVLILANGRIKYDKVDKELVETLPDYYKSFYQ